MAADEMPSAAGADLARIALRQAKAAARARGAAPKKIQRRSYRHTRGDGRDPLSLEKVMQQLVVDHGWERGKAGGDLVNRWPEILGERAQRWRADHFDEETRTLTVVCESDAWATTLRLTARQIVGEVNEAIGPGTLQAIKVTRTAGPSRRRRPEAEADVAEPVAPTSRWQPTGAEPTPTFRAALEQLRERNAARAAETPLPRVDPYTLREPEEVHAEARYLQEDLEEQARRRTDPRARALARARRDRAARNSTPAPSTPSAPRSTGAA
ncbi:DciA family protein [Streptomyces ipomoeae]|uniref:DciA family protein n=1 Tax=Streptomyces ipomoeae TaxID=103232 RepID=UPI0011473417|nr:DUF721 domain-containing protein [Streptomyces ipomoeae]TQE33124.1 DUF721 domain-containing protein [Streptomyces ipomoeae]